MKSVAKKNIETIKVVNLWHAIKLSLHKTFAIISHSNTKSLDLEVTTSDCGIHLLPAYSAGTIILCDIDSLFSVETRNTTPQISLNLFPLLSPPWIEVTRLTLSEKETGYSQSGRVIDGRPIWKFMLDSFPWLFPLDSPGFPQSVKRSRHEGCPFSDPSAAFRTHSNLTTVDHFYRRSLHSLVVYRS